MGNHWHFVRLVRVTSHLFFGNIIVVAIQSMGWRKKKLEIGNQLGNYCNSWVRAKEGLIRAVMIIGERQRMQETFWK